MKSDKSTDKSCYFTTKQIMLTVAAPSALHREVNKGAIWNSMCTGEQWIPLPVDLHSSRTGTILLIKLYSWSFCYLSPEQRYKPCWKYLLFRLTFSYYFLSQRKRIKFQNFPWFTGIYNYIQERSDLGFSTLAHQARKFGVLFESALTESSCTKALVVMNDKSLVELLPQIF